MDWNLHPKLYQLLHWWHWITYGQNAAGLSAVVAVVATIAAIVVGFYAYQTFQTSASQLAIARDQYWDAHKVYLESVRPHLIVRIPQTSKRSSTGKISFITVIVRNAGAGRAINITGTHGIIWSSFSLAAGAESEAQLRLSNKHFAGIGSQTFFLYYSSVDGRKFRSETTVRNYSEIMNEEEVDISAGIEPKSFEELMTLKIKA